MERVEWLKQMREMAEMLYDHFSPEYWVRFGLYENAAHREYLQKFLERVPGAMMGSCSRPDTAWSASTNRRGCWPGRGSSFRKFATRKWAYRRWISTKCLMEPSAWMRWSTFRQRITR